MSARKHVDAEQPQNLVYCGAGYTLQVNLVLEYCDWGCLRDALDAGAFFSGGSLNYAAILDTAADVAKAMLHLHCNQVWAS